MNETTNLIQWKNLTKEVQAGFDFEGYDYEYQRENSVDWAICDHEPCGGAVYQLKLEDDKWYWIEFISSGKAQLGKDILITLDSASIQILRPAKPDEIPKPETLEDRVKAEYGDFDVVMFRWRKKEDCDRGFWSFEGGDLHIEAQSMYGFAGYVYEIEGKFLPANRFPTWAQTEVAVHPIAVLFSRGEE